MKTDLFLSSDLIRFVSYVLVSAEWKINGVIYLLLPLCVSKCFNQNDRLNNQVSINVNELMHE